MIVREKRIALKQGRIGVISDTHGLIRPEALAALKGSELIIHAGDIGKPEVLASLKTIAPVYAIRGNNDRGLWAKKLPDIHNLEINGLKVQVIHALADLAVDPISDGISAIISGHSHKPSVINKSGVLFVNPGSAGPRRFDLPVALGKIRLDKKSIAATIFELKISRPLR
jgi:putative phosphoesterase